MTKHRRGGVEMKVRALLAQLRSLSKEITEGTNDKPQGTTTYAICNNNLTNNQSDEYKEDSIQKKNDEFLIYTVKQYPQVYNSSLKEYNNKDLKEDTWEEIAFIVNMSLVNCQNRWARLCEWFAKEQQFQETGLQNEITYRTVFPLHKNMLFLKNYIKQKKTDTNMTNTAAKELTNVSSTSHSVNTNTNKTLLCHQLITHSISALHKYMKKRRTNISMTNTAAKQEKINISRITFQTINKKITKVILILRQHIEQKKANTNMTIPAAKKELFNTPNKSHIISRNKDKLPLWKQLVLNNKSFLKKHLLYEIYMNTIKPIAKTSVAENPVVKQKLINTPSTSYNIDTDTNNIFSWDQITSNIVLSDSSASSDPIVENPVMKNPVAKTVVKKKLINIPSTSYSLDTDTNNIFSWNQITSNAVSSNSPASLNHVVENFVVENSVVENSVVENLVENPIVENPVVENPVTRNPVAKNSVARTAIVKKELIDTPSTSNSLDTDTYNIFSWDLTSNNFSLDFLPNISSNFSKENTHQAEDVTEPNKQLSLQQWIPTTIHNFSYMNQATASVPAPNNIPQNGVANQPSQQNIAELNCVANQPFQYNIAELNHSISDSIYQLATELEKMPEKLIQKRAIIDILRKLWSTQ